MRLIPAIPTNSLFVIEEKWEDKLNNLIWGLKGHHAWSETSIKEVVKPHLYLHIFPKKTDYYVEYDRRRHVTPLALSELVGVLMERGARDLLLDKLSLKINDLFIHFENIAPPPGSPVEEVVKKIRRKYLKRHGLPETPDAVRSRFLRFSGAYSLSNNPIDPFELDTPKFRASLEETTRRFLLIMEEKEVERTKFVGIRFCPTVKSPWIIETEKD